VKQSEHRAASGEPGPSQKVLFHPLRGVHNMGCLGAAGDGSDAYHNRWGHYGQGARPAPGFGGGGGGGGAHGGAYGDHAGPDAGRGRGFAMGRGRGMGLKRARPSGPLLGVLEGCSHKGAGAAGEVCLATLLACMPFGVTCSRVGLRRGPEGLVRLPAGPLS